MKTKPLFSTTLEAGSKEYTYGTSYFLCNEFVKIVLGNTPKRLRFEIYQNRVAGSVKVGFFRMWGYKTDWEGISHNAPQLPNYHALYPELRKILNPFVKSGKDNTYLWIKISDAS